MPEPRTIRYCRRCVNPDTRPNVVFNEDGVCAVCLYEEAKQRSVIDWRKRRSDLEEILQWGRANSKGGYDCIVTVSGGKDSTRQALFARDEMGANPLLVSCVYPPEQLTERGAANITNLISLGFDTVSVGLNPQVWKDLMRIGFLEHGNWARSTEMALYAIPIHVAIAYKIPLIFLGENPALTIGEKHGGLDGDASRMKEGNTIKGGPRQLAALNYSGQDLHFYEYPPDSDMEYARLRIVYLGYYIQDWSGSNNARFAIARGLKTRPDPPEAIGDLWGFSSLDEDFRIVNQYLKYLKFGFGHVTDQAVEAINAGTMTRTEAIELVKQFDGCCDKRYVEKFCGYLGIPEDRFWEVAERFRNTSLWYREGDQWVLRVPEEAQPYRRPDLREPGAAA